MFGVQTLDTFLFALKHLAIDSLIYSGQLSLDLFDSFQTINSGPTGTDIAVVTNSDNYLLVWFAIEAHREAP